MNDNKPAPPDPFFMQTGNGTPVFGGEGESPMPFGIDGFNMFAPPIPEQNPTPTNNSTTENQKYAIFDLFWLLNPKFSAKISAAQNEAHFVIISFNASFGNLRIGFFELLPNSIQGNVVYLENLKRVVTGTIYPASAFNAYHSDRISMICLEQLFKEIPGADWQKNRPVCHIEKNESRLRLSIKDSDQRVYFYDFEKYQRDAFLYACNFATTTGFELTAKTHINRT